MSARYVVGIDLGTTNSALASIDLAALPPPDAVDAPRAAAQVLSVPQVVAAGSVLERGTLPSFLYTSFPGELPAGALDLPWAEGREFVVGGFARDRGAEVPLRQVASAKSWLCHAGVDRRADILPFQAPPEVAKLSPITAARRYLEHLRDAWDRAHPEHPLGAQHVFLTVPASFDAVARDLTLEAAHAAGLPHPTLLEEPQAAFYAWLERVEATWRKRLRAGDLVLVADVGGGTTDFSLIEVRDADGNLSLERVAVGDHVLLGGDNMDLALAQVLVSKLAADGKRLDAGQYRALVQAARAAKERLLGDASLDATPITILGRGSKLIGNKVSTELRREEVETTLLDGFLPLVERDAEPQATKRSGLAELGLPFASDAAITRHLASFLRRHLGEARLPTHLLFNGGVFNSPVLRARLLDALGRFGQVPAVLEESDHDLAVARGAAFFGLTKHGRGIRIRGGVARSYYVGIESAMPAVPGLRPPIRALCVVPFGMEEGTHTPVPSGELGLVVGHPVEFRVLSSSERKHDRPGVVLDEFEWPGQLVETAPVSATITAGDRPSGALVPVRLEAHVTDVGTLELWCVETQGPGRHRLEFDVRESQA